MGRYIVHGVKCVYVPQLGYGVRLEEGYQTCRLTILSTVLRLS